MFDTQFDMQVMSVLVGFEVDVSVRTFFLFLRYLSTFIYFLMYSACFILELYSINTYSFVIYASYILNIHICSSNLEEIKSYPST